MTIKASQPDKIHALVWRFGPPVLNPYCLSADITSNLITSIKHEVVRWSRRGNQSIAADLFASGR